MRKPNIVFFIPDSYRGDVLGHLGNPAAVTPNLDRMVSDGAASYANAFAQNPVCTPSRCSFMTGWYPHVHGHRSMLNMLKPHEPNLLSILMREGYHVWWGGKNDLVRVEDKGDYYNYCHDKFSDPDGKYLELADHGCKTPPPPAEDDPRRGAFYTGVARKDEEGTPYRSGDEAIVHGAVDFIRNRNEEKPFFLFLPLGLPHPEYLVEEEFYNAIDPSRLSPRIPVPEAEANLLPALEDMRREMETGSVTEETWREVKRIYYAMCAKVDSIFGLVVAALQEAGLYDDTLILFFSDHGDFAGDYSLPEKTHLSLQDSLLRVPFIVKPPSGKEVKPGRHDELVELVDISATIYDLLDIDPGYACQGVSLLDSLAGRSGTIHDAVFAEVGARQGEDVFMNKEVKKLSPSHFYSRQNRACRPHHLAGSHAVSCRTERYKYIRRTYTGQHELFDLENDPGETINISGRPEYAEAEQKMETRLLDFMLRTADVLPCEHDSRKI